MVSERLNAQNHELRVAEFVGGTLAGRGDIVFLAEWRCVIRSGAMSDSRLLFCFSLLGLLCVGFIGLVDLIDQRLQLWHFLVVGGTV